MREVSKQLEWHGQKYSEQDWKFFFLHALRREKYMPGPDGGIIPIPQSSSRMNAREFSELIEVIYAFGAKHGVKFADAG